MKLSKPKKASSKKLKSNKKWFAQPKFIAVVVAMVAIGSYFVVKSFAAGYKYVGTINVPYVMHFDALLCKNNKRSTTMTDTYFVLLNKGTASYPVDVYDSGGRYYGRATTPAKRGSYSNRVMFFSYNTKAGYNGGTSSYKFVNPNFPNNPKNLSVQLKSSTFSTCP